MDNYKEDQGEGFGVWDDSVSRLLYDRSFKLLDMLTDFGSLGEGAKVADLGGANGLSKDAFPRLSIETFDKDESKNPDMVADVSTCFANGSDFGHFDACLVRLLLHYLTYEEIVAMARNLPSDRLFLIQIVCTRSEQARKQMVCSAFEAPKLWRSEEDIDTLLAMGGFYPVGIRTLISYEVRPEFYRNRLGAEVDGSHTESLLIQEYAR